MISADGIRALAAEWIAKGLQAAGPQCAAGRTLYLPLRSADDLLLDGFVHPANSPKEFVFEKTEKLYSYRIEGSSIELSNDAEPAPERLLVAVRPCDAAAFPILDHVFNWDCADEFYNRRRKATTIVALACSTHDADCFCTSVGLGPASEKGADALLVPIGDGNFEVRTLTEKGAALFSGKTSESAAKPAAYAGPEVRFDAGAVRDFCEKNFEHPLWAEQALACLGCGACASTCPTCHCFDIVDEHRARVRNWDSCQFAMFTLHASGHNPRPGQASRQRQRILHKFSMYPAKFGEILCTGCGNCARNCPAGIGVLPVVTAIENGKHLQA
jgi:ferredoxin